jgi:hypothetical protein
MMGTRTAARAEFNLFKISILAAFIGILGGITAEVLDRLIGLVINLSFYGRISTEIVPVGKTQLGVWVIFIPMIGGLLVGLLAR